MATNKPRFSVSFSDESFQKIENYREKSSLNTRSKAVAQLVELALNEIENAPPPDIGEGKLVDMYRALNAEGKEKLLDCADDMVRSGKYKKGRESRLDTKEA